MTQWLSRSHRTPGELAVLRRHTPDLIVGQPVFHRLLAAAGASDEAARTLGDAVRWATIAQCMAICSPNPGGGSGLAFGASCAQAEFSESRFTRLMAARGQILRDQFALLARYLHAKNQAPSWTDAGLLLWWDGRQPQRAAEVRYRLARDYYHTRYQLDADHE